MAQQQKRVDFIVPKDLAEHLEEMQAEMFDNLTRAEMIRTLLQTGVDVIKKEKLKAQEIF